MTTAYTSLLGLALPVTGELSGTWGDIVNNSITSLLDSSIAGTTNVSTDTDVTLTTTTGAANTAREAILLFSGARTALRTITAPAQSKVYTVINATTGGYSVKLVGAGPTTGVTIVAGESAVCAWNGSDFVKVSNTGGTASFTNVTVTGTTTLSGLTASTALALDASKNVVSVTNTGTGNNVLSASPTLTGTVGGASLTLSSLTSGRVTYAGASGLLQDSANLTFDGTILTAPRINITNTGTGVTYQSSAGSGFRIYGSSGTHQWDLYLNGGNVRFSDNTGGGLFVVDQGATIQGLTVGLGAGAVSTNTAVGNSALASNTSGLAGVAVGYSALNANTTGYYNVAVGRNALIANTTADGNTALGDLTLTSNTTGASNVAVGRQALQANTTASNNTAVGYQAGYSNTTGANHTVLGKTALYSNTTGAEHTAIGVDALNANTTGNYNVALGVGAAKLNTTGSYNTALGYLALLNNTTASNNTAVGYQAGYSNTTGTRLTALGYLSGYTSNADRGTFIGAYSGQNTTGVNNTFVGDASGYLVTSGTKNTIIGLYSGNAGGLDIRTASNYIVLSDGDGNPRQIIDSSGNLGLGVTPSAWTTAFKAFQVGATGSLVYNGSTDVYLSNNYASIGGASKYITTAAATLYQQGAGVHAWYNAPSGTAGNAITFTQAMTLDASGNLEIGGTFAQGRKLGVDSSTNGYTMQLLQTSAFNSGNLAGTVYSGYYTSTDITDLASIRGGKENTTSGNFGGMLAFYTRPNGGSDTERARIDSSGNMGIGTTSPATKLEVNGVVAGTSTGVDGTFAPVFNALYNSNTAFYGQIQASMSSSASASGFRFMGGGTSNISGSGGLQKMLDLTRGATIFYTSDTERARIDSSGNLLVGTTSNVGSARVNVSFSGPSNDGVDIIDASDGSGSQFIAFRNSAGTAIGTVTRVTTTNAVTYNTTSDYRLKNVIGSVLGSGQRIDALKPIDYIWKESGQNARGFLAHEFQTVYPNSVTGDKDAIDADGNPVYQGMQASTAEVIADLVAEIQSLRKRLADAGI